MQPSPTSPEYRRAVRYEWLTGSLMHCDVTGFTAMSETLAQSGKEGAEIMAGILNQFFERMLGIANQWGGIQMKFGGDAMLLYFKGEQHAQCAVACGLQMQKAMEEFSEVNINETTCRLRMRIGIHSGQFYAISAGQSEGLLHYLLIGNEVNKAADVEPMAEPDQVVVSTETKILLSKQTVLEKTKHDGIWWVTKSDTPKADINEIQLNNIPRGFLKRYLMPPIAEGKTAGLLGEHRRVSIVFINLFGLSELLEQHGDKTALDHSNQYLNIIFESMDKYRGYLITSDVCEHGDKVLIAFGAPVSVDYQEENAMRFALEIQQRLRDSGLQLQQCIGVNSGFVFTGEIGSKKRREYTTIGDTVNLAARLMTAADKGGIIVSATTAEKTTNLFNLKHLDPIRVKGKSQPINIYELIDLETKEKQLQDNNDHSSLIGRDDEINLLLNCANNVIQGKSAWFFVNGEPGIGKTHLCAELRSQLAKQDWSTMLGICESYNMHNAFSAWIYPLQKLLDISTTDNENSAWVKIKDYINSNCPDLNTFAPLVAEILSISHETNAVISSLDPKTKREKRISTVTSLIASATKYNAVLLIFDNIQWIDSSSVEIFKNLFLLSDIPLYVGLISRDDQPPIELAELNPDYFLELKPLSARASRKIISSESKLNNEDKETILGRAKGNPFFLKELSQSGSLDKDSLPESIFDVIMVRLDHLGNRKRSLLRNASVIGQIFDIKTLDTIELEEQATTHEKE